MNKYSSILVFLGLALGGYSYKKYFFASGTRALVLLIIVGGVAGYIIGFMINDQVKKRVNLSKNQPVHFSSEFLKDGFKYLAVAICIAAFGLFIYPGMYKYDKLNQKYPVMINRITGETKVLKGNTWETVGNADAQLSKFEEYKQQVYTRLETQNDDIKNSILSDIKDELEKAKDDVISEARNVVDEGHKYDDLRASVNSSYTNSAEEYAGETFGEGDTEATVKEIMGTPDTISKLLDREVWYYGASSVTFVDNKVSEWSDFGNNLHLK
ncbi:hypothetical protein G5B47_02665 [Paenibacillus sp. 7124]|uniref:Uncharacterized protein n=1 Tax=Paenibacillus apii TaxID=1850370 RepID=A0A6M1PLU0_9BACL|nr:hypothetical protein [Paenibacillus apii]NGM81311.1 hypothetical protein [Paenibacillus apii]